MNVLDEVRTLLGETLSLGPRAAQLGADSRLLGSLPEFDSMAVVDVIAALEGRFDFTVADDEIDARAFETLGSLVAFVDARRPRG